MTDPDTYQTARPGLERHVQSAALTILMLLMGWVGNTLIAVDKRTAVIETQFGTLAAQVARSRKRRAGVLAAWPLALLALRAGQMAR